MGTWRTKLIAGGGALALVGALLMGSAPPAAAVDPPVTFSSVPISSWRVNGTGYATLKVGNTVYVGGSFSQATSPNGGTSVARANLAAFDVTTGALITTFRADTNGTIRDIQTDGTSIFISGAFTTVGGTARARVAAIDPATGALRTGFRADVNGTVYNMSLGGGKLYVAGSYTTIGGISRTRLSAVSPTTGAVDPNFNPVINGTVLGVAAQPNGSKVYLGGPYTSLNGVAAADMSTVDGATGATVGPTLTPVTGYIDELEVTPDGATLVSAHSGVPGVGNRTAAYNTTTGARLWRQTVDGDSQGVHVIGGSVFSGFHDGVAGDGAVRMTSNNLVTGARDSSFQPVFDRFMGVWGVSGDTNALVVAGEFNYISGVRVQGFAIFRPGPATPLVGASWGYESWRYLDNGTDQGTDWRQPGFNDASWKSGVGQFGYGDGDEQTRVSYGPSSSSKYITTYFRRTFNLSAAPAAAGLYMRIDDGAVAYINGVEAVRDNMPTGTITSGTLAAATRDGGGETESKYAAINPALLHAGTNTIAVEVHQAAASSNDLTFFPTLVAYASTTPNQLPTASFTATPSSGQAPLAVALNATASSDPDGTITGYAWNFGDGTTGSGATTSHTYGAGGTYTATLTVTDNAGGTNTTTRTITVTPGAPNQLPTASFTATPSSGQAPLSVALNATASSDPDGTITGYAWNFGDGTTGSGATTSHTYGAGGTYTATLTVTDNAGGTNTTTRTITVTPAAGPPVDLPRSATWKYLDTGVDQGTAWRQPTFDDSTWKSGVGEFGYGDGDENTVVSFGPNTNVKYVTTYFRTTFGASAVPGTLTFSMRVDDGAVVYINGVEAARFNIGTGAVSYATRAPLALSNSDETLDRTFTLDPALVHTGTNVISVEVHQNTLGSSDLTFWGSLTGN